MAATPAPRFINPNPSVVGVPSPDHRTAYVVPWSQRTSDSDPQCILEGEHYAQFVGHGLATFPAAVAVVAAAPVAVPLAKTAVGAAQSEGSVVAAAATGADDETDDEDDDEDIEDDDADDDDDDDNDDGLPPGVAEEKPAPALPSRPRANSKVR